MRHASQGHTHTGEASVVIKILHRNLFRQIGEHHHAIVRTFVRTGIAQRRHAVAEIIQTVETLDAAASGRKGRRLGNRIDTDSFLAPINVTEAAGDGFQQRLCICHIVIAEESTLCRHITQRQNRTVFIDGIQFFGRLNHFMERNGGNIQRLVQEAVIQIVIRTLLAHVHAHSHGIKHEVDFASHHLLCLRKELLQIVH